MSVYEQAHAEALVAAVGDIVNGNDPTETIAARFGSNLGAPEIAELIAALASMPYRINWVGSVFILPFYEAAADALRAEGYEAWTGLIPGRSEAALVALRKIARPS